MPKRKNEKKKKKTENERKEDRDREQKRKKKTADEIGLPAPWSLHFFKRHKSDDPTEEVPAQKFIDAGIPVEEQQTAG